MLVGGRLAPSRTHRELMRFSGVLENASGADSGLRSRLQRNHAPIRDDINMMRDLGISKTSLRDYKIASGHLLKSE